MSYPEVPIGMAFDVRNGATPSSGDEQYWDGDIPWVTPADLGALQSRWITQGARSITPEGYAACGTQMVPEGSLILSTRAPIGHLAIAKRSMCFNQGCRGLIPRSGINYEFAYWALWARRPQLEAAGQGSTFVELSRDGLRAEKIPVPDIALQRAIADFLDRETAKIDALIAAQERLIALLDEKRQATITHAVTKGLDPNAPMKESGVEWLGKVPAQWPAVMLRFLLNYIEQGWSPEAEDRRAEPGEWAVLKSGCVNGGIFRQDEHKALPSDLLPIEELEVRPGDVIMSRASGSRALIGSVSYVEKCSAKLMLSDKLFRLRPRLNMISPRYLAIVLGAQPCRAQIEQSISGAEGLANNLTQATIKRLLICLPSLVEQEIIMHHLDRVTAELDQLRFHGMKIIERLRERRTALITAAVTGQIDVSRPAITEAAE